MEEIDKTALSERRLSELKRAKRDVIARFGANLPAGTIASTETWLNQRTGAY